jgi:hypothetical protein
MVRSTYLLLPVCTWVSAKRVHCKCGTTLRARTRGLWSTGRTLNIGNSLSNIALVSTITWYQRVWTRRCSRLPGAILPDRTFWTLQYRVTVRMASLPSCCKGGLPRKIDNAGEAQHFELHSVKLQAYRGPFIKYACEFLWPARFIGCFRRDSCKVW